MNSHVCNNDPFPCSYCKAGFPEVRERILLALRAHWAEEDERARQVDRWREHEADECVWHLGENPDE